MAHTKVLLREDVDDLGARGEIVRVRAGYARNYLLPRKLAVEATKSGEQGALYGSVTSMDLAEALKERGYEIDRHRIHLREPLKRLGEFTVPIRLHREVTIELKVKVIPEGEVIVGHLTPEQEAEMARTAQANSEEEATDRAE